MSKVVIIAIIFAGGFVGLLIWIVSGAKDQVETRDQLVEDGGKSLKRGRGASGAGIRIPKDRPRKAAHVLVEMRGGGRMKGAIRSGGTVVLSMRGNGVAYRRDAVDGMRWFRYRVKTKQVDKLLELVATLPTTSPGGGAYTVTLDLGKGKVDHFALRPEAMEILGAATGLSEVWTPDAIVLRTVSRPTPPRTEDPEWPKLGGLKKPDAYVGAGAEYRAPKAEMRKLLKLLEDHRILNLGEQSWLIAGWVPIMP